MDEYVVSLEQIAKNMDVTIDEYPFEHQDGVIINDEWKIRIWVRDTLDSCHRRFAIAHELWHLSDDTIGVSYSMICEKRATRKWIDLMINSEKLKRAIDDYGLDCDFLHTLFWVSIETMEAKKMFFTL